MNLDVELLRGDPTFYHGPMNCGKTRDASGDLEQIAHAGFNVISYQNAANDRDGANIVVDGQHIKGAAVVAKSIDEVKSDFIARRQAIFSRKIKFEGQDGFFEYKNIRHRKFKELVGVHIDEMNLFCTTPEETKKVIDFIHWGREENIVQIYSGLLFDFRHQIFGYVDSLLPYVNSVQIKAKCKSDVQRKQCGKSAIHSQRLWSRKFAEDQGLGSVLDEFEIYDFWDKNHQLQSENYIAAPYWDKTLRIEEAKDGRNVYLPVCSDCASLPHKDEVFTVYESLQKKEFDPQAISDSLNNKILHFLLDEEWIHEKKKGKLDATPLYRTKMGVYVP